MAGPCSMASREKRRGAQSTCTRVGNKTKGPGDQVVTHLFQTILSGHEVSPISPVDMMRRTAFVQHREKINSENQRENMMENEGGNKERDKGSEETQGRYLPQLDQRIHSRKYHFSRRTKRGVKQQSRTTWYKETLTAVLLLPAPLPPRVPSA